MAYVNIVQNKINSQNKKLRNLKFKRKIFASFRHIQQQTKQKTTNENLIRNEDI